MTNRSVIEIIKQKLPIESVVGSYVKLERSGTKWKARCPFHHEKTPSFQVDAEKGFYYCFGCHKGGDILSFVQEIEGVEFYDALKLLAEKAGVDLPRYQEGEKPSKLAILREIMEQSTKLYEISLRKDKQVVEYLLGRGLTKETMIQWRLGYAIKGWSYVYDFLKKKPYRDEDIIATGLCLKSDRGNGCYDRFRERIMFPISDSQGRVVAFTGRVLPGTEESTKPVGKYINSPETDLYHKSSILFGFHFAKSTIHQKGFAILVEGQMDCVMSHQAGFANTIALSGTACTDEHMVQLGRFTRDVALALDDDAAGLVAAQKSALVAYRHGMQVTVITIPNGKDPADAIQEDPKLWEQAIVSRTDYITFRLQKMKQDPNQDKIAIATKELFPVLQQMQYQITIDEKLQEIARAFGVSQDAIRKDFEQFNQGGSSPESSLQTIAKASSAPINASQKTPLWEAMIGILSLVRKETLFESLNKKFNELGQEYATIIQSLSMEQQARIISETEKLLGSVSEHSSDYERAFSQFYMRYKLLMLDEQKQTLDTTLHAHPQDIEALAQLHRILQEKDHLIHALHNH